MGTDVRLPARMYQGQWVVSCPRCPNVEKRGRCDDGTTGGVDAVLFVCRESHGGCGYRAGVAWPGIITQIEALTAARPRVFRNWTPGETLHDLLAENLEHGIVPTAALEGHGGLLLAIHGDDVTVGALESAARPELERTT